MAKTAKTAEQTKVRRQGRRVVPALRNTPRAAPVKVETAAPVAKKALTLGELIAAAFDTVGGDADKAAKLLGSREMERAIGRRIVVV